jgi:hypothetical protein
MVGTGVGVGVVTAVGVGVADAVGVGAGVVEGTVVATAVGVDVGCSSGMEPGVGVDVEPGVLAPATVSAAEGVPVSSPALPCTSWAARTSFCEPSKISTPAPPPWSCERSAGRRDVEPSDDGGGGVATVPSGT